MRIPGDVSVASLDDARWMTVTTPGITAARRPSYDMGARAATVLLQSLAGQPGRRRHLLPADVIRRESVAAPRRADAVTS
ncbi:substrate-binding domain-containing protein [Tsukamurella soli]|uniref:substrate-binding domain-containing protein n=1 Tax=Tsukamurella soli TaxID=644556 RepID=UPI0031E57775